MEVFRITKAIYADRLVASGGAARWNSRGTFLIYTASSRALAVLGNVVHRTSPGLQDEFRVMVIDIPDYIYIKRLYPNRLADNWFDFQSYSYCQNLGDSWAAKADSAVLQAPSAIVSTESDFILNPNHADFSHIQLVRIEKFAFDPRIKD